MKLGPILILLLFAIAFAFAVRYLLRHGLCSGCEHSGSCASCNGHCKHCDATGQCEQAKKMVEDLKDAVPPHPLARRAPDSRQ